MMVCEEAQLVTDGTQCCVSENVEAASADVTTLDHQVPPSSPLQDVHAHQQRLY